MTITISKLPSPEPAGDWHDKPLKWLVTTVTPGFGEEHQKFATRQNATEYYRVRRTVRTQQEAIQAYCSKV